MRIALVFLVQLGHVGRVDALKDVGPGRHRMIIAGGPEAFSSGHLALAFRASELIAFPARCEIGGCVGGRRTGPPRFGAEPPPVTSAFRRAPKWGCSRTGPARLLISQRAHSARSVRAGSVRIARVAGAHAATTATIRMSDATPT